MNSEVLSLILGRFPPSKELLNLRLVNRDWNKVVSKSKSMDGIIFTVDKGRDGEAIEVFHTLHPDLRLAHFRFANQNFEGGAGLLRDPELCLSFITNHCPRIQTIYLLNCNVSSGRFFELLSHCPKLNDVRVMQCPSAYQTNMTCLSWRFSFKSLTRNLAGLRILSLAEKSISEKDMWGLSCEMRSLKKVAIGVNEGEILPRHAITKLLRNNCNSLEELTLVGSLFPQSIFVNYDTLPMDDFPRMCSLRSLTLLRGHFHTFFHTVVLENIFKLCTSLRELKMTEARLERETLGCVEGSLTKLELIDCSFATGVFGISPQFQLVYLKVAHTQDGQDPKNTIEAVSNLLMKPNPNLQSLELSLPSGGDDCLKWLTEARFPNLTELSLDNFSDIGEFVLRRIFNEFYKLENFALTNCPNLVDECFCSKRDGDREESLANLSILRQLNLSGTMVSNSIIEECLLPMNYLEILRLEATKVDKVGLIMITSAVKWGFLPCLWCISLDDAACEVPEQELQAMLDDIASLERNIQIYCDVIV